MTQAAFVDHSPPTVDHTGLIGGTPWSLVWVFGAVGAPENLTGQTALLYLQDVLYTPTVDGLNGTVTINFTANQTTTFIWDNRAYLLLLQGIPQVKGTLYISSRITP